MVNLNINILFDKDLSELAHRVNCILFFGTEFLCGTEPPVFKLHKTDTGASEYISVVETASPKDDVNMIIIVINVYPSVVYDSNVFWQ